MKLRIKLSKEGKVRFISHLEYARALERALRRAKLPVAWTEGFNPHIKLSLASALSVGVSSLSEYAEIELAEDIKADEALENLNRHLPHGIRALAADTAEKSPKLMALLRGASYRIDLPVVQGQAIAQAIDEYNNMVEFIFTKKPPQGKPARQINLKDYVTYISYQMAEGTARLFFDCAITPQGSVKAADILYILDKHFFLSLNLPAADITRTALYGENKQPLIGG